MVRRELEQVLASPDFVASDRLRKFLRFVVEEALAGRGDRLHAYPIALEVLGRDASFDPQTDPVVRMEAGRLRRRLERYYLEAGQSDPVRIESRRAATRQPSSTSPMEHAPAHRLRFSFHGAARSALGQEAGGLHWGRSRWLASSFSRRQYCVSNARRLKPRENVWRPSSAAPRSSFCPSRTSPAFGPTIS
jgi:hypothetical protein